MNLQMQELGIVEGGDWEPEELEWIRNRLFWDAIDSLIQQHRLRFEFLLGYETVLFFHN